MERRKDSRGKVLEKGESQRSDGSYMYRYNSWNGRKCIYAKDLKTLREREKEINDSIDKGIDYSKGNAILVDVVREYLDNRQDLTTGTKGTYNSLVGKLEKSTIGKMQINQVTTILVKNYFTYLYDEGLSYSYLKIYQSLLSTALQQLVEDNVISKNPFDFKFTFKNNKKVRTALTKNEEEAFFKWLKDNSKWSISEWYDLLYFIRCTGVRIGEAVGLTWNDIDLKQRTISINHQLLVQTGTGFYISSPKSESGNRTLYITDEVMAILERLRKKPKCATIVDGYGGFIFYTHTGKVCRADNVSYQCKRLVTQFYEDTGIQITLTPHILRHTFCTRMAEQGMNPKTLQYIMGHSNISMTMNTYTHFNFDSVKDEVARITNNDSV